MTPFRSAAVLLVGLLLATSLALTGPGLLAGASAEPTAPAEPRVVDVVTTGGVCASGSPLLALDNGGDADTRVLAVTADVEVPNPSYVVRFDRFERVDDGTYALHVVSEPTDKPAIQCVAHARYTATVETPQPALVIVVYHDGEEVGRVGIVAGDPTATATQTA